MVEEQEEDKGRSITEQITERLVAGATKEELVQEGYNAGSVRVIYSELKKKGLVDSDKGASKLQVFARGSPAEAIINSIEVPSGRELDGFTHGVKFGMSLLVVGVRLAQEMSTIGVQQAKPLVNMAREMRAGEEAAAKSASQDAAAKVGGMLMGSLDPRLAALEGRVGEIGRVSSGNPMLDMMARIFEPYLKNVLAGLPGMVGPQALQAPEGWTIREE